MRFAAGEQIEIPSPIDVHTHLREPGGEHKETIASGTLAALYGGYQAVFDMPNNPGVPTWSTVRLLEKEDIAVTTSNTDIGFYAGVDLENPDIDQLRHLACRAAGLKLYMGHTTGNTKEHDLDVARPAIDTWIEAARLVGRVTPILLHAREEVGLETATYIAEKHFPVHWCHVSTASEVDHVGTLNKRYTPYFTAGVTPHHLLMTSRDTTKYGWNGGRMMPPLGDHVDADKLLWAFNREDLHILETDHAPHTKEEKLKAEGENPNGDDDPDCTTCFGISGIEHVLPVMTSLVQRDDIEMERLVDSLYYQPARMLRLQTDPSRSVTTIEVNPRVIAENDRRSKSSNNPYVGWTAWGKVLGVEVDGKVWLANGQATESTNRRILNPEMIV